MVDLASIDNFVISWNWSRLTELDEGKFLLLAPLFRTFSIYTTLLVVFYYLTGSISGHVPCRGWSASCYVISGSTCFHINDLAVIVIIVFSSYGTCIRVCITYYLLTRNIIVKNDYTFQDWHFLIFHFLKYNKL